MFPRILVGLDGSPGADSALTTALGLAERFHSTLVLAAITDLRVLEAPLYGTGSTWAEGMPVSPALAELEGVLGERAARLLADGATKCSDAGVPHETEQAAGIVDEELLRLAARADAMVVGRRGELHEAPGTVGAVTVHVIRRCDKPVIVAGDGPSACLRPVVAFDGGPTSTDALALAAGYAAETGVNLDVVHVSDDAANAAALLERASHYLGTRQVRCSTHHLGGEVARAVADHVAATRADVLLVGAHGRPRRRLLLGSQVERLLKATSVPTIVVR